MKNARALCPGLCAALYTAVRRLISIHDCGREDGDGGLLGGVGWSRR